MSNITVTKTAEVTIGWTQSSMPEYSSFGDGYKPGASQHVETISIEVPVEFGVEDIAWAALTATNSPFVPEAGVAAEIAQAIEANGYHGQGAHYSLSKGDTVTYEGQSVAFTGYAVEKVEVI